jgi:hypothetical protein
LKILFEFDHFKNYFSCFGKKLKIFFE